MKVIRTTGQEYQDQEFFESMNWHNFNPGDIVWLEDYEAPDAADRVAGIFITPLDDDTVVVRLLPLLAGKDLLRQNAEINIDEVKGKYWQTFLANSQVLK